MKLSEREIITILNKEIKWCIKHPYKSKENVTWEKGFIAGLEQAQLVLTTKEI